MYQKRLCNHCLMKQKGASTDYCTKCKERNQEFYVSSERKLTGLHHPTIRCESGVTFGW